MPSRFDVRPMERITKLTLDVENSTVEAAMEHERPAKVLNALTKNKIFTVEHDRATAISRYVLHAKPLGRFLDAPKTVAEAYHYLYTRFGKSDDALPVVNMSVEPISNSLSVDHRYGMIVELRWPEIEACTAAQFATEQMRKFARTLPRYREDLRAVREDMYVNANRGIVLEIQTNPAGSCSIESDYQDYTGVPTVELGQHNLYNSEQQLVCLVGAVAFANADQHLAAAE